MKMLTGEAYRGYPVLSLIIASLRDTKKSLSTIERDVITSTE